jgi:hypothetical protein
VTSFFINPWKYLSNVVSNYLFRCYLLLQTHDTYEHFRNHSWHFCHNSSILPTSCKQLCFQHANDFQEPLNDSRSLILTRFDIWNLILKIWDSSPQKKTSTWNLERFFLTSTHVAFCVGRCFTLVNSHHVSSLNSIKKFIFLCHSTKNANLDEVTWWMEFIHMDFHLWLCNPFIVPL